MNVWIDRVEKIGRLMLWLALAAAVVILPIEYVNHKREATKEEQELKDEAKKAEERADALEKAKAENPRITLASLGGFLSGINYTKAEGGLFFTNVSQRTGVLCVVGVAQDPATKETAESIAGCEAVTPYASAHLSVDFAGGDLSNTCPKSNCLVTFKEAQESKR
jgi:uncharacterized membrane protein